MIDFKLDPKAGSPFYRQIIDQIKFGIASGKLKIGEQLPTVRSLAVDLKINLNTVAKAYKELEIQNILETQQGTGTFISVVKIHISPKEKEKKLQEICNEFSTIAYSYGFSVNDLIVQLKKSNNMKTKTITKGVFNPISVSVLIVMLSISIGLYLLDLISIPILVLLLISSIFIATSINIANQWEKAVVLRMGKYKGLRGPGLFLIIPIIDRIDNYIDQRVRVTDFKAEQTLTKDTVPVNVDAVVYWTVWDVEKAALEVQEYEKAISYIAQTGLRDIIGKHELADLLQERDRIAEEMQKYLTAIPALGVLLAKNVGIKDIVIPAGLADAMSKEAQAERERRARVILGPAETEIALKFAKASEQYKENPVALHLRGMNMLFEGLKEKGSMVIVPSSALDSMNLGAMGGLVSLGKSNENK